MISFEVVRPPLTHTLEDYLAQLSAVLTDLPELRVVSFQVAAWDPLTEQGNLVAELARHPNVYLSCSMPGEVWDDGVEYPDRNLLARVERLRDTVGPERIMWATDWPWFEDRFLYQQGIDCFRKHALFFREGELDLFLGDNAERFMAHAESAFRVGGVYDPVTAETHPAATIVVRDGRITRVAEDAPAHLAVEDFSHAVAMPGLIDAHTHLSIETPGNERAQVAAPVEERLLRALRYAEVMLAEGVTTIRILGEPAWFDIHLRDGFAAGLYNGPRILGAGRMLAPSHANVSVVDAPADGADVVGRVRQNLAHRVNWIKLYATPSSLLGDPREAYYSRQEIEWIIATAHRAGVPVAAHAHGGVAVDDLIEAGVETIEHGRLSREPPARADGCTRHLPLLDRRHRSVLRCRANR